MFIEFIAAWTVLRQHTKSESNFWLSMTINRGNISGKRGMDNEHLKGRMTGQTVHRWLQAVHNLLHSQWDCGLQQAFSRQHPMQTQCNSFHVPQKVL